MIKRTPAKPKLIQKLCWNRFGNVTFLFVSSLTWGEIFSNVIYTQVWVSLSKLFKCLHWFFVVFLECKVIWSVKQIWSGLWPFYILLQTLVTSWWYWVVLFTSSHQLLYGPFLLLRCDQPGDLPGEWCWYCVWVNTDISCEMLLYKYFIKRCLLSIFLTWWLDLGTEGTGVLVMLACIKPD